MTGLLRQPQLVDPHDITPARSVTPGFSIVLIAVPVRYSAPFPIQLLEEHVSNEQGTLSPDPSGAVGGGRWAQPAREAGDKASERKDFVKKAGLAAIGGAFSGTFRVVAAAIRDALLSDPGTDLRATRCCRSGCRPRGRCPR